jgi:hypothetical protein
MTTRNEIEQWFDEGASDNFDRMIIVCDTFDYEDFPVFATENDFWIKYRNSKNQPMQKIMEVYNLNGNKEEQLNSYRVFNLPEET